MGKHPQIENPPKRGRKAAYISAGSAALVSAGAGIAAGLEAKQAGASVLSASLEGFLLFLPRLIAGIAGAGF